MLAPAPPPASFAWFGIPQFELLLTHTPSCLSQLPPPATAAAPPDLVAVHAPCGRLVRVLLEGRQRVRRTRPRPPLSRASTSAAAAATASAGAAADGVLIPAAREHGRGCVAARRRKRGRQGETSWARGLQGLARRRVAK